MPTDLDIIAPEHVMNSCSDERPINAGSHGCPRCTEIVLARYERLRVPAARYQFMATCQNEQALDLMAEKLGQDTELAILVDALIQENGGV